MQYSSTGFNITPLSRSAIADLAKKLDPETYRITQDSGTERAFCGTLLDNKKVGEYCCVVCGLPLFSSSHKFNSGTGWPSFFQPADPAHIVTHDDSTLGMQRIEIRCARCTSHLGHVFDDGPKPTGLRYCLNGAALKFYEAGEERPKESTPLKTETAYFAGGCFWGIEHYFQSAPGVLTAVSGYMGGSTKSPTYQEVCEQDHVSASKRDAQFVPQAEAVKVVFDPSVISFSRLLEGFFEMHDPTELNKQGPDTGTQYRSAVFYVNDAQRDATNAAIAALTAKSAFSGRKIVTQVQSAVPFTAAEEYHQDYLVKHPERACHIGKPWWLKKSVATSPSPSSAAH